MTLELIGLVLASFAAGMFTIVSAQKSQREWKHVFFLGVFFGLMGLCFTAVLLKFETEKTKARIEQVKEIRRTIEAK